MMMEWDDVSDWIIWGLLVCAFLVVLAVALMALAVIVQHAIRYLRLRRTGTGNKAPPLFIDELVESIPDVPYQELPDAGDDRDRDSCVICVTPYEAGEACSVLPGCTHMFHKPCVARWLRKKNTCPLCRATVGGGGGVPAHPPPPRQPNVVVNAAENAV